jgi:hypothetical protein
MIKAFALSIFLNLAALAYPPKEKYSANKKNRIGLLARQCWRADAPDK